MQDRKSLHEPARTRGRIDVREVAFFVILRVACAVVTYGLYILLLAWTGYLVAYVIAYALGIVLAYVSNAVLVFKQPINRRSALSFPLVYIVQFLLGLLVLRALVEWFQVPEWLGLGLSVLITLPITYLMSRWAIHK